LSKAWQARVTEKLFDAWYFVSKLMQRILKETIERFFAYSFSNRALSN
jgi:hypothetical protein